MSDSSEQSTMSTIKLALLADRVRAQLADGDALAAEPIAIIGMGCRFPGGANTPEALWQLIHNGIDAISEVPADRWDVDEFYDDDPYAAGHMNTRWGGFVDGIDQFDASYFGISPREAAHMDPQQRMVLEVAIDALERAGQTNNHLAGSRTGVFVASSLHDYSDRGHAGADDVDAYSLTGNAHCFIPNRLSFLLDLRGPSVAIDTACSSSLVAVHLACQSLRTRDSNMALAGGVNVMLSPETGVSLSKWVVLAPDGRCKTFDARADGFVRSEGCGIVVLKRLSDAIADNDPVVAVIRGSAVNQDGKSTAMSAPNGLAQQDVIRRALSSGQVLPEQISCIEAHGTGTVLGDPIEVEAIAEVLGAPTPGAPPVALTAVKTNLGHLEAAAGVAGLLKMVLCLQHGEIPAPLHFQQLNSHISLEGSRLFVPTQPHPWSAGEARRIAGISSFGFGGTNAHVVVEEAPRLPAAGAPPGLPVLVLSAQTTDALREMASATADHLESSIDASASTASADLCSTAALRRTHHDQRLAVVGATTEDLVEALRAFAAGQRRPDVAVGRREPGARRRVAFVCSGQGNQWWGMARELLASSAVFRGVMEECDGLLREHVSWSLLDELARSEQETRLERTEIAQPAIFALQVGLAAVWRSWGIKPDAVVGHSIGEVAAAHLAGALSLAEAVRVVAARATSMQDTFGKGAMASVELPVETIEAVIAPFGGRLSVAATNAPDVTVISGEPEAVAAVVARLQADGAAVRTLPVTYPFHSAQMVPSGRALELALAGLGPGTNHTRFVSTVTGRAEDGSALDAAYWARNVVETVRFADAIGVLVGFGCDTFIELGPHPVLGGAIARSLGSVPPAGSGAAPVVVASLRRGRPDDESMAIALGQLHCTGVAVDWAAVWPGRRPVVALPTYPWQRRRHWVDTWQPAGGRAAVVGAPGAGFGRRPDGGEHPLVGTRLRSPAIDGFVFQTVLTPEVPAFLGDHRIGNFVLVPGMAFVEAAMGAFEAATSQPACRVEDLDIVTALPLAGGDDLTTMEVHLRGDASDATFVVTSTPDGETWTEHARGRVAALASTGQAVSVAAIRERCSAPTAGGDLYAGLAERGINFGPSFRGVQEAWVGAGEALARIVAPEEVALSASTYRFHPALLDATIHAVAGLLPDDGSTFLPIALGALHLHQAPPAELWSHIRLRTDTSSGSSQGTLAGDIVTVDIAIVGVDGEPVADIVGLRVVRASAQAIEAQLGMKPGAAVGGPTGQQHLYAVEWQHATGSTAAVLPAGPWLVIEDSGGIGADFAVRLRSQGLVCDVVAQDESLHEDQIRTLVRSNDVREVVYLRGLDTPPLGSAADPVAAQQRGLGGAMTVTQGLLDSPARLWLVTCGAQATQGIATAPEQATLSGFGAAIAAERADLRCVRIDLDSAEPTRNRAATLVEAMSAGDEEEELVAVRAGDRVVARLVTVDTAAPSAGDGPSRLASSTYGVLDGLHAEPLTRRPPGPGEVEIEVAVTGLNFRDVLVALDLYPERSTVFGDECTGVVVRVGADVDSVRVGDRVLAMAQGSFATHVTTLADLTFPIPEEMGLEAAATIPIPFLTAQYALVALGHLQAGERVLVHAGAGGVGMAAIQLCQRLGAQVFATAGSPEKRATLAALGVGHVFDSRSLDFADDVLAATGGEGVHVVLNSLAGDFIQRSVDVLVPGGRFLEIGRRDVWSAERMAAERPDVDYHIVFLGDLSVGDPPAIRAMLEELMPRFAQGELLPLPRTTFEIGEVVEAFRFMAQARHTGKIVVRQQRASVSAAGTYLVTGGLGGVGLLIARHLVDLGARSVALVGRSGPGDRAATAVDEMRVLGADVRFFAADVAVLDDMARVFAEIDAHMPALRGIVHAAGITHDAVIGDLTWAHFQSVLAPKVAAAQHLHQLSADRDLDMFVVMSSASTIVGGPAQANYVAANAFLDAFASARVGAGRPGLSIGWGAWDRVGMTERITHTDLARMARRGFLTLSVDDGLVAFDAARRAGAAGASHVVAIALDPAALDDRPLLSALRTTTPPAPAADLLRQWIETVPGMRPVAISSFVDAQAKKVLGLPSRSEIPARQPFNELGLDSLMAVELRNAIGAALGRPQPATLLFDHPTSEALATYLLGVVAALGGATTPPAGAAGEVAQVAQRSSAATDLDLLAELTDDEAEAMLLAELGSEGPDA